MSKYLHMFPKYTARERVADAIIHLIGVPWGVVAAIWLLIMAGLRTSPAVFASLAVYCLGLIGMLSASALYNMATVGRIKAILRRIDHAMIFIMIAGTYTPFAVNALEGASGLWLLVAVWGGAVVGIFLKVFFPGRFERTGFALYMGLGWAVVATLDQLVAALSRQSLMLLVAGGLLYSVGSIFHYLRRMPFHNATWHAFVLIAAVCHFIAITVQFVPASTA